jgi:hypothetical protein
MEKRQIYVSLFKLMHFKLAFKLPEQFSNFVIDTHKFGVEMHKLSKQDINKSQFHSALHLVSQYSNTYTLSTSTMTLAP